MHISTVTATPAPAKKPFVPFTINVEKEVEARNLAHVLANHEDAEGQAVQATSLKKLKGHLQGLDNMPDSLYNYDA